MDHGKRISKEEEAVLLSLKLSFSPTFASTCHTEQRVIARGNVGNLYHSVSQWGICGGANFIHSKNVDVEHSANTFLMVSGSFINDENASCCDDV